MHCKVTNGGQVSYLVNLHHGVSLISGLETHLSGVGTEGLVHVGVHLGGMTIVRSFELAIRVVAIDRGLAGRAFLAVRTVSVSVLGKCKSDSTPWLGWEYGHLHGTARRRHQRGGDSFSEAFEILFELRGREERGRRASFVLVTHFLFVCVAALSRRRHSYAHKREEWDDKVGEEEAGNFNH